MPPIEVIFLALLTSESVEVSKLYKMGTFAFPN